MSEDIDSILTSVRERGIRLKEIEGSLLVDVPEGVLTDSLKSRLADNKKALLARLASSSRLPVLKPQPERAHYPLSRGQLRMWAMCQDSTRSKAYNMSAVFEAGGLLDGDLLESAFCYVVSRHESLRTRFSLVEGEPRQFVDADSSFCIVRQDAVDRDSAIMEAEAFVSTPFDLASAPLARAMQVFVSEEYSVISFAAHHIVCDGWSMEIFVKEVVMAYKSFRKGEGPDLPNPKVQYKDFAVWEKEILAGDKLANARSHWKEALSDELERLELPKDRERPAVPSSNGAALRRHLSPGLSQSLKTLSRNSGITQFSLLTALTKVLLYRYTGQKDIIVGVPASGRHLPELGDQIGLFVNTLPICSQVTGELSFSEFAKAVHGELQRSQEHQGYPFDAMLEGIEYHGEASRNPLFDVMMIMDEDWAKPDLPGVDLSRIERKAVSSKFDLSFSFLESDDRLRISVEYSTDLFDADRIERMLTHFEVLLRSAVADPAMSIQDLDMLPDWEREKLLVEFNDTDADYTKDKLVHALFEERACERPDAVALVFEGEEMSYGELNARSNSLARALREEQGVGPDNLVGMLVERSFEMVVGVLGILKAGGAYVPIDPEYPLERIRFMLEDCESKVVLSNVELERGLLPEGCSLLDLREESSYCLDASPLDRVNSPSDLIYCIYTSGSTGKPKGCLVEHRNVCRLFAACEDWYSFGESDVWTLFHYYGFDFSVWEIFGSLTTGGKLVIVSYCISRSTPDFYNLLLDEGVTVLSQTPSAFRLLAAEDENRTEEVSRLSLRHVVFGGEALDFECLRPWVERWGDDSPQLVNMYGITETTVHVTYKRVCREDVGAISGSIIGVPIPDLGVYILSSPSSLSPIGVPGELYVSGAGLARGYLNRPELTAERFLENPFRPGERMYRTGDLARWLPDGNLEFLGRMDDQVKIRGFRVELGEVESALVSLEEIRVAIAVVRGDSLVAYCVSTGGPLDFPSIRDSLSSRLPGYMVPSLFVELESLPLTSNGKVDRKALPKPEGRHALEVDYVAPGDELERELCSVVSEVLGLERVGMSGRFLDLGGDSLKAMRVSMLVRRRLGRELPLPPVLGNEPLSSVASALRSSSSSGYALIEPTASAESYPLSAGQFRMWLLEQAGVSAGTYNVGGALEVVGDLDVAAMRKAFELLVSRHEILRTAIVVENGEPRQRVLKDRDLDWSEEDALGLSGESLRLRASEFLSQGFDLSLGSPLRVLLLSTGARRHVLCVSMHHIAGDGWSIGVIVREVLSSYDTLRSGSVPEPSPPRLQYKDYSDWQRGLLDDGALDVSGDYWLEKLSGLELLELPTDRPRPVSSSFLGARASATLDGDFLDSLKSFCSQSDATLFAGLLAMLKALLYRYTGQEEVVVGTPVLGRPVDELREQVGFYVNTLVLRDHVAGPSSFSDLLSSCRATVLEATAHEDYPFDRLVADLKAGGDASRNPLFDVMMSVDPGWADFSCESLEVSPLVSERSSAKFDLSFFFSESSEGCLRVSVEYSTDLFDADRIERMLTHFEVLLRSAVADPAMSIQDLDMLPDWEREKLLVEFNDTAAEYSMPALVHELFEDRAKEHPDKVALVFGDSEMTYGELDARSNALARTLREERGVAPDELVAMLVDRSFEMVVGIFGILKAGGAYVPIDPEYPADRVRFMLEDCDASTLLCNIGFEEGVLPDGCSALDLREGSIYSMDTSPLSKVNSASGLVYCIYTSGSTGKPKGVLIEHRNVVNILSVLERLYPICETDSYLLKTSYTFDVSVSEIFGWFIGKGSLTILEVGSEKDPDAIIDAIGLNDVSHVNFVPSVLTAFIDSAMSAGESRLASLKYVLVAGEAFLPASVKRFSELGLLARLENVYGPTEAAIYSSWFSIDAESVSEPIPIGKPIDNCFARILDRSGSLCPIGVPGELCVSGVQVGRGYLKRSDLTSERFVSDPFRSSERMYRTGDLARWLPDGNLEFLGRMDHQVKVRGFRIELGEVESTIALEEQVRETAVDVRDGSLVAYCVSSKGSLDVRSLRESLSSQLPGYMVPSFFVELDSLPLTTSGKIDRKALPEPEDSALSSATYVAPSDELEEELSLIVSEVLGISQVGMSDRFLDLGGDSLKAMRVSMMARRRIDRDLALPLLLGNAPITALASSMRSQSNSCYAPIVSAPEAETYSLSSAQKRLYFLQMMDLENTNYNMPMVLPIKGDADVSHVRNVFNEIIRRHESFRTSFIKVGDEVRQRVNGAVEADIQYYESKESDIGSLIEGFVRPFDLSSSSLVRLAVVKMNEGGYLLVFDVHHIVADGASLEILARDFTRLYKKKRLEPIVLQYKDYSCWQNRLIESGAFKKQERYWLDLFSDEVPKLDFVYDYQRPRIQRFEGDIYQFSIDEKLTSEVRELNGNYSVTLFMSLLAVLNVLLHKCSGQRDIVVGCDVSGRTHDDLKNVVGMFVNMLPMRNKPRPNVSFADFLEEVKENSIRGFENQDIQFEKLVDLLEVERDTSRNPVFDVEFVVHNTEWEKIIAEDFVSVGNGRSDNYKNRTSIFDISFDVFEYENDLSVQIRYSTSLFKKATIERLAERFVKVLSQVVVDPDLTISQVEAVTDSEKKYILYGLNDTEEELDREGMFLGLFERQVEEIPNAIAAEHNGEFVTYCDLDKRSNQLARYLVDQGGVTKNALVGIYLERSIDYLVSILGVLKSGAAYVSLDSSLPEKRLKSVILDGEVGVVVTEEKFTRRIERIQWECSEFFACLCLDSLSIHALGEFEREEIVQSEELWNYVGDKSIDEITEGGWISSYTGQAFSREEMDEYVENTFNKLSGILGKEMRVLEVGCASGLTMYRIAPFVREYVGTDISKSTIRKNRKRVEEMSMSNIALEVMPAHKILELKCEEGFDVVLLNSVIQSFPSHRYLREVLVQCLELLNDGGVLYLGDVIDLDLKNRLERKMLDYKISHGNEKTKVDWSKELFISRSFFEDFASEFQQVSDVVISEKEFTIENELMEFRYDVVIKTGGARLGGFEKIKHQHDRRVLAGYGEGKLLADEKVQIQSDDLAYVIYTSGTTGVPKGAMVHHLGMVNHICAKMHDLAISGSDRVAQTAPAGFDISVWQFLAPLAVGATTCIIDKEVVLDPERLLLSLRDNRITIFESVPSLINVFLNAIEENDRKNLPELRWMIPTGEALTVSLAQDWFKHYPDIPLLNAYGPTEASDDVAHQIVKRSSLEGSNSIPIGNPVQNLRIYILSKEGQICPIGVKGEICVSGIGVGKGYWKDGEKTKEVFVQNPFSGRLDSRDYETLYKTGDLGYVRGDGLIECLGRVDDQVKIRGNRIELGEIEFVLKQCEQVSDAVVIDFGDEHGEKEIFGYYTTKHPIDEDSLRDRLKESLPDYMVPSFLVELDEIPLTLNGKLDRKRLPEPNAVGVGFLSPKSEMQNVLRELWGEVLEADPVMIGVEDDFFKLGGHSLKAIVLVTKIHKALDVKVSLEKLFESPTIVGLERVIVASKREVEVAIERVEEKDYYFLSPAQKRLYILQQMDAGNTAYNMPLRLDLDKQLDRDSLESALRVIVDRHESLRTSFHLVDGEPVQKIHERVEFELNHVKIASEDEIGGYEREFTKPFKLSEAPLFRVLLLESKDENVLLADLHHVIADGVSLNVLKEDIQKLCSGQSLAPLRLQYKDYAEWLRSDAMRKKRDAQMGHWIDVFSGDVPVLDLPTDYARPSMKSFEGSYVSFSLNKDHTAALYGLGERCDATLFMVLLAAYSVCLSKLSGQEDLVVGMPAAGRTHDDLSEVIGMFVNTLPIRSRPNGDATFASFLGEVKRTVLAALENQDFPFEEMIEKVGVGRDRSRNPLFDVMLVLQNQLEVKANSGRGDEIVHASAEVAKFDMTMFAVEATEKIDMIIEFCTRLFLPETIERFIAYFKRVIDLVSLNPDMLISDIEILDTSERYQAIVSGDDDVVPLEFETLQGMFENQVAETPNNIAVVFNGEELSYLELNRKANQLARTLRGKGVGPGDIVAVIIENSFELVVGVLGVLKSGAGYLPIDVGYPKERVGYIWEDSAAKYIVAKSVSSAARFDLPAEKIIGLDHRDIQESDVTNPRNLNQASDICYLLYTSGTTGKPKGVVVQHSNLVNYLTFALLNYIDGQRCNFPLFTSISFDLTVTSLFTPIVSGNSIIVHTGEDVGSCLRKVVNDNAVDIVKLTPAHLEVMGEVGLEDSSIRRFVVGGENLSTRLARKASRLGPRNIEVFNEYGPTEATVGCMIHKYDRDKDSSNSVPIGVASTNNRIYLLDRYLKPVPRGVVGEIYIGGKGVSRGYWNAEKLSSESFIDDPFADGKIYKTGDLARMLPSGEIEFLGREDHQVKIRGFRVELGEIEKVILREQGISECVVVAREELSLRSYLCAYVVSVDSLDIDKIKARLSKELPDYMVPPFYVCLDRIPLTVNGKVDRRALPEVEMPAPAYRAPRNDLEKEIQALWADAMDIRAECVSIDSSFFDLGGNSLLATMVLNKMRERLGVDLALKDLFERSSVRGISELVETFRWLKSEKVSVDMSTKKRIRI